MTKWLRLTAKLYPASWRRRYGSEFDALLDDVPSTWHEVLNVLLGATKMQLSTWGFRNILLACGLAGALLAGAIAYRLPNEYVSRALVRVQAPALSSTASSGPAMSQYISRLSQEVFSRHSLMKIIEQENLYTGDRSHKPLEDVIETMKGRDIKIEVVGPRDPRTEYNAHRGFPSPLHFTVSFSDPDPVRAQHVTNRLIASLADANLKLRGANLELLDPASKPDRPTFPNRKQIALIGLALGLLAGLVAAGIRQFWITTT